MDLSIYDIILGPVISDKAYELNALKQLVLRVHMHANKPLIKEALWKLYNVKTKDIRVAIRKGKNKRVGRHKTRSNHRKIAYITLAEGYSLNFFEQAASTNRISANVGDDAGVQV